MTYGPMDWCNRVCCCGCTTCHLLWHCCWWHLLWCDVFANDSECNEMPTTFIQFFWIAITISLWMVARAPGKTCALWVRMSMGERGKCIQHSIHFFLDCDNDYSLVDVAIIKGPYEQASSRCQCCGPQAAARLEPHMLPCALNQLRHNHRV